VNVVAIGAHYDDIELGCGGTMAKYEESGHNTYGIVVTVPEHLIGMGEGAVGVRRSEGFRAARILGYTLICLDHHTRRIEYSTELVKEVEGLLYSLEADVILTQWVHDVHQDHEVVGRAVLRAARHLPRVLMFRTNWYKSAHLFNNNFYVAIESHHIELKRKAIEAHRSEYERNGKEWLDFFIHQNMAAGRVVGMSYAEEFEVVKWLE